jgi:Flp pilus assembly protein protease CpaA
LEKLKSCYCSWQDLNLFVIANKVEISLLLLVELKFLVVLVELKSLGGVGKVENLFATINKIKISLQL